VIWLSARLGSRRRKLHQRKRRSSVRPIGITERFHHFELVGAAGQQSFAVRNDAAGWAVLIVRLRGFTIAAIGRA